MITNNDKIDILNNRLDRINRDISNLTESIETNTQEDPAEKTPRTSTLADFIRIRDILIQQINDFTE